MTERHRKGWCSAFEALLDHWRPEGPPAGLPLDEDAMTMVSINADEWLIARGEIHARGGLREINAYLLGSDGLYFTPGQRDWIAPLRARPLRLYRVTDVDPGIGMPLIDELDAPWTEVRAFRRSYWEPTFKALRLRYRRRYNARHNYATMVFMSGLTPAFCPAQLGHSVGMLLSTYAR